MAMMRWIWILCVLALLAGCERAQQEHSVQPELPAADLVLKNAYLYSADQEKGPVQTIALHGGRIVYVGGEAGADPFIGPHTQVENLQGKLVVPADTIDLRDWGQMVNLYQGKSVRDYQEALAKFIGENPDRQVIVGRGWDSTLFISAPPHKDQLDQVNDQIPILLFSRDHRSIWVNSEALAAAGIDSRTQNPQGGAIEKDETGLPTGLVRENAMQLVEKIIPQNTETKGRERVAWMQEIANCGEISQPASVQSRESGNLQTGDWADLLILNKGLQQTPLEEIRKVQVLLAYCRGKLVYDAKSVE
jgi:hypothetical protein